jgi:hypothetical protein
MAYVKGRMATTKFIYLFKKKKKKETNYSKPSSVRVVFGEFHTLLSRDYIEYSHIG